MAGRAGSWIPNHHLFVAVALALAACEDDATDGLVPEPAPVAEAPVEDAPDGNRGTRPDQDPGDARPRDGKGAKARPPADGRTPAEGRQPGDPPGARNPQARKPGQPAQPGQPRPVPPKPEGITQVSATKWTVTRSLADQWMKNPYTLGNVREAGEGWQLVGVRAKAAHWLGMHNGDVIMEANGHKLDTRPQLLAAYLDLKNDQVFRVTFVRNGQTIVHTYQILEPGGGGKGKGDGGKGGQN